MLEMMEIWIMSMVSMMIWMMMMLITVRLHYWCTIKTHNACNHNFRPSSTPPPIPLHSSCIPPASLLQGSCCLPASDSWRSTEFFLKSVCICTILTNTKHCASGPFWNITAHLNMRKWPFPPAPDLCPSVVYQRMLANSHRSIWPKNYQKMNKKLPKMHKK